MKSLYVKFLITTLAIMLFSFFFAFFISNFIYQINLKEENDTKHTNIALEVAQFIENNPDIKVEEYLDTVAKTGHQIYLVDANGRDQFFGTQFGDINLQDEAIKEVHSGEIYHGMANFDAELFVTGFFADELKNTVGVPVTIDGQSYALFMRTDIELLFNEMHVLFGVLFLITIILSIILVLISAHYLIKPVTKLSKATKRLASGDYSLDNLDISRKDEIGDLATNFRNMTLQLGYNDKIQRDFISNISHDIQSPLSNIKGYNQLLKKPLSTDVREDYAETIDFEIDRLSTMTKQLLVLSSIDHEDYLMRRENYNLKQQLERAIKVYEWQINERELMISHKLIDIDIRADKSLLNTVWDNLLSNAVKYNEDAGSIDIEMADYGSHVIVSISDTGKGIDNVHIDKIFDRFYRADNARTNKVGGSGLGLSIVKKLSKCMMALSM
ncbi:ATP-binding protein [Jeotgalicoccus sp. S0W5]|uniref:HAMP domain-containing sensor histidine kinase n=1 Tax=Jeotgalicoccus sp. S0W5 TaxID=2527874 RepID=UPI0035304448